MFIRVTKTTNKKSGQVYFKHNLVESVRVNGQPRQQVIMSLGKLDLPKKDWKKLAHALECQLSGQQSLLETQDKYIEELALALISNNNLSRSLRQVQDNSPASDDAQAVTIDLQSIQTEKTRSVGAELVCQNTWDLLGFDKILKDCSFSQTQRDIAKALIFGRLISPGSERHTIEWFRKRSALPEFSPIGDIADSGKDIFYEIGDKLYQYKDAIEEFLFHKQQALLPPGGFTVFLYDLTNTYLEGSGLHNSLAKYGHCKSKRTDCPLITLSLMVRNDGAPVASHIYKGNQSEPETLKDILNRLHALLGLDAQQQRLDKPTLIMDRGIATIENLKLLRTMDGGYPYIVVTRVEETGNYREEFEQLETFTHIDERKLSVYGEPNDVYVKKIGSEDDDTCIVLCKSEGKARKENAITAKKDQRFLNAVQNLNESIQKGSIKQLPKIQAKLNNHVKKHKLTAEKYTVELIPASEGNTAFVQLTAIPDSPQPLAGCYVIETTHTQLSAVDIWSLYMTQEHVESAFRSMKGELGMRPVYHQNEKRSSSHLFITVLAYHILSAIERRLASQKDTRQWNTIREVLSTHTRNTVVFKDMEGQIYQNRVTGKPEDVHQDIYKKLGVKDITKAILSRFGKKIASMKG